ncbi:uncharacterized protein F5891DRAFT_988841 [Suillus fuscotomentosus]|uniref:Uncharacterized protein n=1 Tax=Suillus fuscotomentosus TaxID=1912939 RepID=A0AAD4DQ36_9AGAM|nr:uncharacterized protein F5891DRAFT_988841 [Suillus fuscotomentosus]KAG1886814.1 hypothetical protein F5891DRAFT_988841 [Suillus fuscotomentosus]
MCIMTTRPRYHHSSQQISPSNNHNPSKYEFSFYCRGHALAACSQEFPSSWCLIKPLNLTLINQGSPQAIHLSIYPNVKFVLDLIIHEEGIVRVRMDEEGELRKQCNEAIQTRQDSKLAEHIEVHSSKSTSQDGLMQHPKCLLGRNLFHMDGHKSQSPGYVFLDITFLNHTWNPTICHNLSLPNTTGSTARFTDLLHLSDLPTLLYDSILLMHTHFCNVDGGRFQCNYIENVD